ncbi:NAD-dependent protein deacylase [Nitrospira sp. KM1]|uniref:SIR2 family NAD-dependent protein deacylase n=1 Tax=Nitrospira sp. KM1 TaxID=1936990 RepID=UPI0013A71BF6|nr:NAD-dependent deacylase [Nitrospira sp. KM1]BCA53177.1 NAD-dependent protein deacylase [Nitrospira sp. KM1]
MDPLAQLKERISGARSLVVLTGAGISADSGVPTFRGTDGLWRSFRAEDLATPEAFARDPRLVWEWYDWRRGLISTKRPNAAHVALADLERRGPSFHLITQNVDGLHRNAGSQWLTEIHGNIWMVRCTACGSVEPNHDVPIALLPICRHCRGLLRPHIVWFGEALAAADIQQSLKAVQSCDVLLVVGTSGVVYPAAGFASLAKEQGAFVAEINIEPTGNSHIVDVAVQGRARDVVPLLL